MSNSSGATGLLRALRERLLFCAVQTVATGFPERVFSPLACEFSASPQYGWDNWMSEPTMLRWFRSRRWGERLANADAEAPVPRLWRRGLSQGAPARSAT